MTSILAGAVRHEPLAATDGRSGSLLERVMLAGGETPVVKHASAASDWIMRATGDDGGRVATLWSSGLLRRVPEVIEHAILAVERDGDGWVVVMRDVASALLPDDARLSRAASRRVLEAAAALHATFHGGPPLPPCSLADRIDATREQVLDGFRAAEGERHDEDALRLALLGGLVHLGWDKALHATGHPDPAVRARERADLAWWTARAEEALERWSP